MGLKNTEVVEYRIVMPLSAAEFERAQVYAITEGSKAETSGGGGVEVLVNRSFAPNDAAAVDQGLGSKGGHYTHKIYHLQHHAPGWLRPLVRAYNLEQVHEEAWNAYPYCKTIVYNPKWKREDFLVTIESLHLDNDLGEQHNALGLPPDILKARVVTKLDICDDSRLKGQYVEASDPKKTRTKDGRGPWLPGWQKKTAVFMCAYKAVTFRLRWRLFEGRVRKYALYTWYPRGFTRLHREALCSYDAWAGKSMAEIREEEAKAKAELDRRRATATFTGTLNDDEVPKSHRALPPALSA